MAHAKRGAYELGLGLWALEIGEVGMVGAYLRLDKLGGHR